jgi:hypothetical protein
MQLDQEFGIPTFIWKLWCMLNDSDAEMYICWSASGNSVIVKDQDRLATVVFPKLVHSKFLDIHCT